MAVLKVKDPADPTGNTWIDITGTGTQGPPGGPVPVGGNIGEVIEKTGAADMAVGWAQHPRIALRLSLASIVTPATINTMADYVTGNVTIDPARTYHIFASHRCVQDMGVGGNIQMQVALGTVNLHGYDVVACTDPNSLWGAWSQSWLEFGSSFTTVTAALSIRLRYQCSVASRTLYSPRLYVIEM